MHFNCGPSKRTKILKKAEEKRQKVQSLIVWHPWFAWYPVRVSEDKCIWFEWVQRRLTPKYWPISRDLDVWETLDVNDWKYREYQNEV